MNCYFVYIEKIWKAYMPVNENVTTASFCASGWLPIYISRKRFLARPWWYLVQWTLKMNSKLNLILWLRKLQIKWAKLCYHVLFTTQHTGLHNQIVQDGISSLANNVKDETFKWEWSKENLRVPFSNKDLSEIRNAMSWVKTFQIAKV